jgi:hypothetical protein
MKPPNSNPLDYPDGDKWGGDSIATAPGNSDISEPLGCAPIMS